MVVAVLPVLLGFFFDDEHPAAALCPCPCSATYSLLVLRVLHRFVARLRLDFAMDFLITINHWLDAAVDETWGWFESLSQQEWIALLSVVACLGFLCMRGFSSRGHI